MRSVLFILLFILGCNEDENLISSQDIKTNLEPNFKLGSINSKEARRHISQSNVTFLEVGSESCYSCKIMGKNIEDVKTEKESFNVIFVDVFKDMKGLKEFNVKAIPTQLIMNKSGKELYRHVGVLSSVEIKQLVKKYNIKK